MKKAIIFIEGSELLLKEKFWKNDGRRVTLYRTDSFGSLQRDIRTAKQYSYIEGSEYGIINGKVPGTPEFFSMYVDNLITTSDWYIENKTLDKNPFFKNIINLGYIIVDEGSMEILEKEYLYELTLGDNESNDIKVTFLSKGLKRERELKKILE